MCDLHQSNIGHSDAQRINRNEHRRFTCFSLHLVVRIVESPANFPFVWRGFRLSILTFGSEKIENTKYDYDAKQH